MSENQSIIQFAGERMFKVGEHLEKLKAKWLIVLYAPFALDFCPQRCRTHQTSEITCVRLSETVVMLTGRLTWVYYQQISNFCRPDNTTDLHQFNNPLGWVHNNVDGYRRTNKDVNQKQPWKTQQYTVDKIYYRYNSLVSLLQKVTGKT